MCAFNEDEEWIGLDNEQAVTGPTGVAFSSLSVPPPPHLIGLHLSFYSCLFLSQLLILRLYVVLGSVRLSSQEVLAVCLLQA